MSSLERLSLDCLEQMVLLVEPETLHIVLANRAAERVLGYSAEQLCRMTILDVECALQDVFYWEEVRNGQLSGVEAQEGMYLCADGSMRAATKTVSVIERAGTHWLLVQAQEQSEAPSVADDLAHTTSQLRATLESTGNGILVLDWQGRVASMNRRFSTMWQIPEAVLLSHDDQQILSFVSDRLIDTAICHQRMSTIVEANETQDVLHLKDGRVFECKSLPQYLDERIVGRVFAFNDITERIRIEEDLIAARERAEAANRAKAAFLAMMSHEIRTPMNGVMGMATLMQDTPLNDEQRRYLDIIRSSAEALLSVINDVLDFSKIEAQKLTLETIDFNLLALLEDFADLVALRAAEKGLEFAWQLDAAVPILLRGDPGRLRQILTNLVGNALKFTETGTVSVLISRLPETESMKGRIVLRLEVRDTGIGIAEDDLPKIFAPFEQADTSTTRKYGGTGLGLTITRQLVELMAGRIEVSSTVGQGTSFVASLVLFRQSGAAGVSPMPEVAGLDALKGARLLVVDDFDVSRDALVQCLAQWGVTATAVNNAEAAISALKQGRAEGCPYRAVIVDQSLPGSDGETLGQRIAADAANRGTALVMCAAAGFRGDAQRFSRAGFAAYLHKPVRQAVLQDCLRRVLAPTASDGASAIVTQHSVAENARRSNRLLVVEDNAINMVVVQGLLGKLGFRQIDKARDGLEAIEAASRNAYDLILMDCQMPRMDGYEATRRLREMAVRTPIVAMTAHVLSGEREQCRRVGMDDYLSKPLALEALRDCLDRWVPATEDKPIKMTI